MSAPVSAVVPRLEKAVLGLFLGGLAALHLRYAFVLRLDSDETQHLHVVWGWTQGLLPYRDFFDNHAPLFSWLCAPLLAALGERPDIVTCLRLVMLALVVICLGGVYRLGSFHFGRRVAAWAVVATGFAPVFFYTSSEVRTDTLWTALWLLSLVVLLTGRATPRRLFFFGFVFGCVFATSFKTVLLAAALLVAALLAFVAGRPRVNGAVLGRCTRGALAVAAGLVLVPGAFAVFFACHGAWQPLVYCLITHNVLPGMAPAVGWWRFLLFPFALPILFTGAWALWRRPEREADPRRGQRIVLLLATACYPLLLTSYWPLLTRQDYLPSIPLLVLALAAGVFGAGSRLPAGEGTRERLWRAIGKPSLAAALVGGEIAVVFLYHGPWRNRTVGDRALLATVLRLTGPQDDVMDLKGETIFRRRPFYYALEGITRERIRRGLIADDIAQRLVTTHTAVVHVTPAFPYPPAAQAFVSAHYLSVGAVSVLGQVLEPGSGAQAGQSRTYRFNVAVPADYVVIDPAGQPASGQLDGAPLSGTGRRLEAGAHEFSSLAAGRLIVFWARAWKEGLRPLAPSANRILDSHG